MNEIEDLLREGMERFTRDLQAPAGLTRHAARRRRRRLAQRSMAAAAAAAAATAVAVAAAVLPGVLQVSSGTPEVTTAYVVKQVSSALSAAEPSDLAQIMIRRTVTTPGGKTTTNTAEEWSYGDRWRSLTYSPTGRPLYDEGFSGTSVYTLVSYQTRTWARKPGLGRPGALAFGRLGLSHPQPAKSSPTPLGQPNVTVVTPRKCQPVLAALPLLFQPGLPGFGFAPTSLPAARALRNAISCGILAVAGRQRVDGIDAIKLSSRPESPISETIWVTPRTYLPVRVVVRSAPSRVGSGMALGIRQTANFTWLRPTRQNLAKLAVPIPAGFRHVRVSPLALGLLPILQQIPGQLTMPKVICLPRTGQTCKKTPSPIVPGAVRINNHP